MRQLFYKQKEDFMNIIKHKYGKRTVSLLLAVILVLCPLQVRATATKEDAGQ